jgi:hypothetical protein
LDLYVANDHDPNRLYRNDGKGKFAEVATETGCALAADGMAASGMGVGLGDYNHTGRESILVTNLNGEAFSLFRNEKNGLFSYATDVTGLRSLTQYFGGWGVAFADLDRDGWQDVVVATGHANPLIEKVGDPGVTFKQRMVVCRNTGKETFEDLTPRAGDMASLWSRRGMAVGDYDRDGRLDFLVVNRNDRPSLYRNVSADTNHWIQLRLEGAQSPRDGAGAKVKVRTGKTTQFAECRVSSSFASSCDKSLYFGLGPAENVDEIEVRWPHGLRDRVRGVTADARYVVQEGGSCVPER